ncbi:hypothetical protein J6590_027306 [Homalodisca vitripennis]|nr:hypothetical protein J6590_027306 [Homalodisca vitripennis]
MLLRTTTRKPILSFVPSVLWVVGGRGCRVYYDRSTSYRYEDNAYIVCHPINRQYGGGSAWREINVT